MAVPASAGILGEGPPGYPADLERRVVLDDGAEVRLRPIRPDDAARLSELYDRLSFTTTAKPKIVYVNGTLPDLTTQYTSLDVSGTSEGTGILVVENGNVDISGNFHWNGPIIVTGNNVGIRYAGGGSQAVYGSVVVNEMHDDGLANIEGDVVGNASLLYSREALDLVQDGLSRRLVTSSSWTDQ